MTANNPILQWKETKRCNLIAGCHWIFYLTHCLLLFIFLRALDDAFEWNETIVNHCRHHYFALVHNCKRMFLIFLVTEAAVQCKTLPSILILMVLACCPLPSFSPAVLVRFANFSSVRHDSFTFFFADYFPRTFIYLLNLGHFGHILTSAVVFRPNVEHEIRIIGVSKRWAMC